jgi:hypothetical protein
MNAVIILYWLGTEVDRLWITIRTMKGTDLKVEAYQKWKKVYGNPEYTVIVKAMDPETESHISYFDTTFIHS